MDAGGGSPASGLPLEQLLQHPYYPPTVAIPGYTANTTPVIQLISVFGAIAAVAVVAAYRAASGPGTRFVDRFAAAWFGLCAFHSSLCGWEDGADTNVSQAAFYISLLKVSLIVKFQ